MHACRRFVRAFAVMGAVLGLALVATPALAGDRHHGGQTLNWQPCTPDGWQCATFKAPRDYGNPHAGFVKIAVTRLPASDQANRIGALFVNYGGPGGTAVDRTQANGAAPVRPGDHQQVRPRRVRSARCRTEHAVDRLQGEPGDPGHLLEALHDAREPRRRRPDRQGQDLHPSVHLPEQGDPALRLDRERGARHGRHPRRHGRLQAQLLRLLVRHLPRRHVREPLPEQLSGDGARRPDRRQDVHQQSERRSA